MEKKYEKNLHVGIAIVLCVLALAATLALNANSLLIEKRWILAFICVICFLTLAFTQELKETGKWQFLPAAFCAGILFASFPVALKKPVEPIVLERVENPLDWDTLAQDFNKSLEKAKEDLNGK